MANDSTSQGFLVPDIEPASDAAFEDAIQGTIVGVIGRIPPEFVRPRWQPNAPTQPMFSTNWVAFGVIGSDPDVFAYEGHEPEIINGNDLSTTRVERDELVQVLLSFYGPDAMANDARLRAGLDLAQNRHLLVAADIAFVEYQKPTRVPSLLKETWVPRVDAVLVLRRRSVHRYQVRSIASATGMLDNEHYLTPLKIVPQP